MHVLVTTFNFCGPQFARSIAIHNVDSPKSTKYTVGRPRIKVKRSNVSQEVLFDQAQTYSPKFAGNAHGYGQVMSLSTPNNLAPLMNRWMRNRPTGRGFQMLLRSLSRPTLVNPFRSFRPSTETQLDASAHHTEEIPFDFDDSSFNRLATRPTIDQEYGSLSHLLHPTEPFIDSLPFEFGARQPSMASFAGAKDIFGVAVHRETGSVDGASDSIDPQFDHIFATEFDQLSKRSRPVMSETDSIASMLDSRALMPFVTYDLDSAKRSKVKQSNRIGVRGSSRKNKRRNGNAARAPVKVTSKVKFETSSNAIESPVDESFEAPLNELKEAEEIGSDVQPKASTTNQTTTITLDRKSLDTELLLRLLDKKLSSSDLIGLLSDKLNRSATSQVMSPSLSESPPKLQKIPQIQLPSHGSDEFFSQRTKVVDDRLPLGRNTERITGDLDQFNYEKDYSYFESPKCASAQNSTFCLQDDQYPVYVLSY
jgi:hypothetical protein